MYAQYLRFLPVAGLRFTLYALYPSPDVSTVRDSKKQQCARIADHTDNCTVNFSDVGTAHCSRRVVSLLAKRL